MVDYRRDHYYRIVWGEGEEDNMMVYAKTICVAVEYRMKYFSPIVAKAIYLTVDYRRECSSRIVCLEKGSYFLN